MPNRTLEQLYSAFLATGDEGALEQLMRRSAPALRRLARRLGASSEDADDLVQETIVAAIAGADRYDASRPLLPWLKGILTFRAAKFARDEVRRRRHYASGVDDVATAPAGGPALADDAAGRELDADVRAAIAHLPKHYHEPLQQYLLAGRSPVEIAQGLDLPRATVRVRLHRGLRALRERLLRWTSLLAALLLGRPASAQSALRAGARAAGGLALATAVAVFAAWFAQSWSAARAAGPGVEARAGSLADAQEPSLAPEQPPRLERAPALADATAATELTVHVLDESGSGVPCVGLVLGPNHGRDPVLHRRRAVTDVLGRAHWSGLEPAEFLVTADRGANAFVALRAGHNEQRLTVTGGTTVTGRVLDPAGHAVCGASIWLSDDAAGPWRGNDVAITDAAGAFTLRHVPAGAFLAARHATFARGDVQRVGTASASAAIELRLAEPGGALRVVVRDERGAPVDRALVFAGDAMDAAPLWLAQGAAPWRPPPFEQRTSADGTAVTAALAAGRHPVGVRAAGHATSTGFAVIERGVVHEHVVLLRTGASLRGRVVDPDGHPVAGALAVFRGADPAASVDLACDPRGGFVLECLPPGGGDVAVRAPGFVPQVTAVAGTQTTEPLRLVLARARHLRGTLFRADAGQLDGCRLRATWPASALHTEHDVVPAAADGAFVFAAAAAATPSLEVQLAGEPLWRSVDAFTTWSGDEATVQLPATFAATAWLAGALRCHGGRPLAHARLFVCRDGDEWAEIGRTGADGTFRLGPLPPASWGLFAETTSPELPTVPVGTFPLAAGERRELEHTAAATGTLDLELARDDGEPIGDVAITLVGAQLERRFLARTEPRLRQALLPGDYLLYVMGSRVRWLEAEPVHIEAGAEAKLRLDLAAGTRCTLSLQGLPRAEPGRALELRLVERWQRKWSATFTLAPDAPFRLGAVLAAGDYELEHVDPAGVSWRGELSVAHDGDGAPILVQMAPR